MEGNEELLSVREDGTLRVVAPGYRLRMHEQSGAYRLVSELPGMLVFQKQGVIPSLEQRARVLMAGEIISRMTVMEIINIIATSNWRGELHIFGNSAKRQLSFDQGALIHAFSNDAQDRLGEVLYRMGMLGRAELDVLLKELPPDRRFGQQLVQKGILEAQQLFQCLQRQAEQIFYNALLVGDGHYLFVQPSDDDPQEPAFTTLHIPVQALLMEGVQRIDEMALFRERIPNNLLCPERNSSHPEPPSEGGVRSLWPLCDGNHSIEELARLTGLGEFETIKAVYHLLRDGRVNLRRSSSRLDPRPVQELVARFNEVMQDVFLAVATYGRIEDARRTLSGWIEHSGYGPFFGPGVEEDGSIDPHRVVEALRHADHERPIEALHQALHELAAFALFAASSSLPREQERALAKDISRRLRAIRI